MKTNRKSSPGNQTNLPTNQQGSASAAPRAPAPRPALTAPMLRPKPLTPEELTRFHKPGVSIQQRFHLALQLTANRPGWIGLTRLPQTSAARKNPALVDLPSFVYRAARSQALVTLLASRYMPQDHYLLLSPQQQNVIEEMVARDIRKVEHIIHQSHHHPDPTDPLNPFNQQNPSNMENQHLATMAAIVIEQDNQQAAMMLELNDLQTAQLEEREQHQHDIAVYDEKVYEDYEAEILVEEQQQAAAPAPEPGLGHRVKEKGLEEGKEYLKKEAGFEHRPHSHDHEQHGSLLKELVGKVLRGESSHQTGEVAGKVLEEAARIVPKPA